MTLLSNDRRRDVLRFVAECSPTGRVFHLDDIHDLAHLFPELEIGSALMALANDGLCGIEDPDLVWSTSQGLEFLREQ